MSDPGDSSATHEQAGSRAAGPATRTPEPAAAADDAARLAGHEIRSHLTVLDGYLSMLEDGSLGRLPEAARAVLSPMRGKTRAISRMVDDMLEDVRQRDGRLDLSRRAVDLRDVVRSVADDARFDLTDSHDLRLEVPDRAVVADVDPKRVSTIVRNLIDNAIKYSPEGGPIECRLGLADGQARITITDRGMGIDPADAEHLFERFERGPQRSRTVDGIGLGLYISRTLARLHGGDITVVGRRGEGAAFTLRLPLAGTAHVS